MELFLRIETHSNILGAKDKNVTYIAVSQITSVRSDSNGGTVVVYGPSQEISVPDLNPDHLMTNCIQSVMPEGLEPNSYIVVNNS
jgi:hypothetical protein